MTDDKAEEKATCLNCKLKRICKRNFPAHFVECMNKGEACDEWQQRDCE